MNINLFSSPTDGATQMYATDERMLQTRHVNELLTGPDAYGWISSNNSSQYLLQVPCSCDEKKNPLSQIDMQNEIDYERIYPMYPPEIK
ncbi:MAG: hypothetical protein H7257_14335 [Taibaiella sp.]|nr:hypothetical protein [Taibaiella sp.]